MMLLIRRTLSLIVTRKYNCRAVEPLNEDTYENLIEDEFSGFQERWEKETGMVLASIESNVSKEIKKTLDDAFQRGVSHAKREAAVDAAKKMIAKHYETDAIHEVTGLSKREIELLDSRS